MKNLKCLIFILIFTTATAQAALSRTLSRLKPILVTQKVTQAFTKRTISFNQFNETALKFLSTRHRKQPSLFFGHITHLHHAIMHNFYYEAGKLIKDGADINANCNEYPYIGQCGTPLHIAVGKKDIRSVEMLLDANAQVNITSDFAISPLDLAIWLPGDDNETQLTIIKMLVAAGAETNYRPRE